MSHLLIIPILKCRPDVVVPALYSCLVEDMKWARNNADPEEGSFDFEYFLIVAPCYTTEAASDSAAAEAASKKKKKKTSEGFVEYANAEDFVFGTRAAWSFSMPLPKIDIPGVDPLPDHESRPQAAKVCLCFHRSA